MTGMTIGEFIDKVFYGDEIEVMLDDVTYFIQRTFFNHKYMFMVDYWIAKDGSEPPHGYLLKLECNSSEDHRLRQFEEAKIFGEKTIYEVESVIKVLFG